MSEPMDWITVNGHHVPIMNGESKQDAINRAIANFNEDKKQSDINKNKEQADKASGKSESKMSMDDVRAYAEKQGDIFIVKNMDNSFTPEEVKQYVDDVNRVYAEFGLNPTNRDQKIVYSISANSKLNDMMASANTRDWGSTIEINPKLKSDGIVYHEMGHAIELQLLRKAFPNTASTDDRMAGRLILEANGWRKQNFPDSTNYISNYGMTNNRELIAEGVRDYMMHGENAKPMSQAIVHKMKQWVNKKLKSE